MQALVKHKSGSPYWRGRYATLDLLVLTSSYQLLFILKIFLFYFFTTRYNCTEPSPSVRVPCSNPSGAPYNATSLMITSFWFLLLFNKLEHFFIRSIILWYYFTFRKEDPPHVEPPLLRQNLGAKTFWVDLTLKMTPPPLILDPIHLGWSALFLYYLSSHY